MAKKIFFDMDGTIADLYGTENWLENLLSEKENLFKNLKPLFEIEELKSTINYLIDKGFEIGVITWTPKNVSQEYIKIVEQEKKEWLSQHLPMIKEIHCLNYGTPKQKAGYKKAKLEILVDDNEEVLEMWQTPKQRQILKADNNLLKNLQALGV